ncbi:MAG: glycosyltransferase family 2 protein [Calditrichaceae bacterium]
MNKVTYALITAARNEEATIGQTIQSVLAQTIRPEKWIIVSDGSNDSTDKIVRDYSSKNDFIELISLKNNVNRNFASKVVALNSGLEKMKEMTFQYIGILDADITFDTGYYEGIFKKFLANPRLGVAGGAFFDVYDGNLHKVQPGPYSVRGAVQMFRYECWKDVGGLRPLVYGGEDTVAEVSARMNGWDVKTYTDLIVYHHRRTGTEGRHILKARFRQGIGEHAVGYHPLFQFVKCVKRIPEKPWFIGSASRLSGYWFAVIRNFKPDVPDDFIRYLRKEQIARIRLLV